MKVAEAIDVLGQHDGNLELHEAAVGNFPFWRGIACTALKAVKAAVKLNAEQSAAWDVVESLICGG